MWVVESSLVIELVDLMEPWFVAAGYLIVAVAVLLERSVFVGLIVPGDFILALGGVYSAQGRMSLVVIIIIGVVAAVAGESIGYWLGRKYGLGLIARVPLLRRLKDRLAESQEFFRRHGGATVVIGRYATAAGAFVPFSAGVGRMPYGRFLAFDVPSIMVWAAGISIFGFIFGNNLEFIDKVISRFGWFVLGAVVIFFAGRFLFRRRREEQEGEEGST